MDIPQVVQARALRAMSADWALLAARSPCCCQHSSRSKTALRRVTFVSGEMSASPKRIGVSSHLLRLRVKYAYCYNRRNPPTLYFIPSDARACGDYFRLPARV
jgi:hypothetical protein